MFAIASFNIGRHAPSAVRHRPQTVITISFFGTVLTTRTNKDGLRWGTEGDGLQMGCAYGIAYGRPCDSHGRERALGPYHSPQALP